MNQAVEVLLVAFQPPPAECESGKEFQHILFDWSYPDLGLYGVGK